MRTITQTLNMTPGGVPPVIHVSQYDSDFTITFTLFSLFGGFTIESGTTAQIRGTKSSGTGYSADAAINISAKTVTVTGDAQMTAAAGQNIFEVVLKKNNKEISSKNFILHVERAALDADTITDESVLKELDAIIEGAETATQAAEEAEDAADRAEAAAQTLVIDPTLTLPGQPADAKVVGDKLAPLIGGDEQREITGWIYGKWINTGNAVEIGDTVDITNFTDWYSLKHVVVECQEGDRFLLDITGATNARAYAFLTSDNVLISRSDAGQTISGYITAPQNTGKVVIQGVYRQSDTDTTTDNGTVYKYVLGSGNVVRFDVAQDKTEAEKARARENLGISSGEGLSNEAKTALLNCFRHVAWVDENGQDYYNALYSALYGGITPSENINVVFNNTIERMFFTDDPIDSMKYHLTVTNNSEVVTDYDLVGTLANNNVRVKIGNEYSAIIPIETHEPEYSWSINRNLYGSDSVGVDGTISSQGARPWAKSNTARGLIGTAIGRIKYGGSGWRLIPVPADATKAIITCQPSTVAFGAINWLFNPSTNMHDYNGSESGWQTTEYTYNIPNGNLRAMSINLKNTNNSSFTSQSLPTSFTVTFM